MDKFKDACGVFGIYGHEDAAHTTYLGLYAQQHRGQESAGIAVANDGRLCLSRAMGYVSDVFTERVLASLVGPRGDLGIDGVGFASGAARAPLAAIHFQDPCWLAWSDRAATSASMVSDLPAARRVRRSPRFTSKTRCRARRTARARLAP